MALVAVVGATPGCGYLVLGAVGTAVAVVESDRDLPPPVLDLARESLGREDLFDGAGAPSAIEVAVEYVLSHAGSAAFDVDVTWRLAEEDEALF